MECLLHETLIVKVVTKDFWHVNSPNYEEVREGSQASPNYQQETDHGTLLTANKQIPLIIGNLKNLLPGKKVPCP